LRISNKTHVELICDHQLGLKFKIRAVNIKALEILLVEDNLADANLISEILREHHRPKYNLRHVTRVEEAINSLCQDNFDVILLNLSVSDSQGIACLNIVRQKAPQSPIIILTAVNDPHLAVQSLRQGAQDYLVKGEFEGRILTRSISYAIERQRTEFNIRQLALMKKMLDKIRKSMDLAAILKFTAREIRQFLHTDQVLIYRCESSQSESTTFVAQSYNPESERLSIEQFVSGVNLSSLYAILTESTSVRAVADTAATESSELQVIAPEQIRSYLILPIWLSESVDYVYDDLTSPMVKPTVAHNQKGGLWGMLIAYNSREIRKWQNWEINFLQRLTTQVTIAIKQSQLCCRLQTANQKLQKLAILDGLTGIANRRYFDLVLDNEWQRLAREEQPLSLILFDIDYFKAYNDTYGHQQGDRCLQNIAKILQRCTRRAADLAARYGGEEFAIILPNTDSEGAFFIAQKIAQKLAKKQIPHRKSNVSQYVTFSMGVGTKIPDFRQSASTLIELTDSFLYQAKKSGRNQIAVNSEQLKVASSK
jgi:two-component system, cell cycle response regulator